MKMPKYPKTLYVKTETEGSEPWLYASAKIAETARIGEKARVGVYKLVETIEVEGQVSTRKLPR
jgi:hypothetical protein